MKIINKQIDITVKGLPAIWEAGGATTKMADVVVVADNHGQPPVAAYIPRGGHLSNGMHACVPVKVGYFVIEVSGSRQAPEVVVWQIAGLLNLEDNGMFATMQEVATLKQGEWLPDLPPFLADAVDAALAKADTYHCREPFFVRWPDEVQK